MKDYNLMDRMNDDYSPKPDPQQVATQETQVSLLKTVAPNSVEISQKKRGRPAASSSLKSKDDLKPEGATKYINLRLTEELDQRVNNAAIKRSGKIGKLLTKPEYVLLALDAFMNEDLK